MYEFLTTNVRHSKQESCDSTQNTAQREGKSMYIQVIGCESFIKVWLIR